MSSAGESVTVSGTVAVGVGVGVGVSVGSGLAGGVLGAGSLGVGGVAGGVCDGWVTTGVGVPAGCDGWVVCDALGAGWCEGAADSVGSAGLCAAFAGADADAFGDGDPWAGLPLVPSSSFFPDGVLLPWSAEPRPLPGTASGLAAVVWEAGAGETAAGRGLPAASAGSWKDCCSAQAVPPSAAAAATPAVVTFHRRDRPRRCFAWLLRGEAMAGRGPFRTCPPPGCPVAVWANEAGYVLDSATAGADSARP